MKSEKELFDKFTHENNIDKVNEMLDSGYNINELNNFGYGILHHILSVEMMLLLIQRGANINHETKYGTTPLHLAVLRTSLEAIKCLVENGGNVNAVTDEGNSPLHHAVKSGKSLEIIKYLIEKGSNVNAKNKFNETPLHLSVKNANLDVVKYLIKVGADPFIRTDNGINAFNVVSCFTSVNRFLEYYKLLLTYFDLWTMDSDEYDFFIQWLPEEVGDDVMSLITGNSESVRSFLSIST